jgi:hypothetical protein
MLPRQGIQSPKALDDRSDDEAYKIMGNLIPRSSFPEPLKVGDELPQVVRVRLVSDDIRGRSEMQ